MQRHAAANAGGSPKVAASTDIEYHGGPVMTRQINVYYIYYGAWTAAAKTVVEKIVESMSDLPSTDEHSVYGWWNINTKYYQQGIVFKRYVAKKVSCTTVT